jgi:imidazolonepropionase-like amidohydrolase
LKIIHASAVLFAFLSSSVAIRDVTIIDVNGGPLQDGMTVILTGNRIARIGKSHRVRIPRGAEVIRAGGKFLIPGLWDMHVHLGDGEFDKVSNLRLLIANGITGIRIMDGSPEHHRWRKEIEAGRLLGPRMVIASPIIGFSPTDETEALKEARLAKREGADFLKVHDNLSRAAYFALVDEARRLKLPIAGHVPAAVTAAEAARARQRSIEHLSGVNDAMALLDLFKQYQTWQCPTLMMRHNYARLNDETMARDPRLKYVTPAWKARWLRMSQEAAGWASDEAPRRLETVRREQALVRKMQQAGVRILAGTDDGNPYSFVGFGLHDELAELVDAGLTPMQALQAATRNPAQFLNKEGMSADLVLLNANPLEDIRNTRKIEAVVVNGKVFDRMMLDELLRSVEAAARK